MRLAVEKRTEVRPSGPVADSSKRKKRKATSVPLFCCRNPAVDGVRGHLNHNAAMLAQCPANEGEAESLLLLNYDVELPLLESI